MRVFKALISLMLVLALCVPVAAADVSMPKIVCTSFPCYDFVRAVVGDASNIRLLIKPGAELHSFEPAPADILEIADCDLFVCIGGASDAWVEDILASLGSDAPENLRLIECVETVEMAHVHDHHDETEYDEHIWTSPVNAMRMVERIADKLAEIDPANDALYTGNGEAYCAEILVLHEAFADAVENAARREMIFADRFPFIYFAKEYGIDYFSAFASCSSESEPSAKTMMELIDRVIADKVPVVYTIELSSGRTAQTIAAETGAKILTFHSVQNLSEADFAAGESYVSLMQRNLAALREGLA